MKLFIPLICIITLLSNFVYIFYGSQMGGQSQESVKDIICEILQIINKHSDSDIAPNKNSLDSFAKEQVSRIKTSPTLRDFLAIEDSINKTIQGELASAKEEVLIDGLTQIYNRKAFDKKIGNAFIKKSIKKTPFTLVMVDIDHFKKINDGYGHTIGDEVLKKVASTIKKTFRLNDFVARYGGEEFSVMIDRIDRNYIQDVCERLRAAIEEMNFTIDSEKIPTTASIGIAFSSPTDTLRTLIERSDRALYLAKESGRNMVKSEEDLSSKKLEAVS